MKRMFLLAVVLSLSACQSIDYQRAEINSSAQTLPEVSVFFLEAGKIYGDGSSISPSASMFNVVADSGLFHGVTVNNSFNPLKIYVTFRDTADPGVGSEQAKMLVSAFTIGLVPVTRKYQFEATYEIVYFDKKVKTYSYKKDESAWVHLASYENLPYFVQRRAAESLTAQFLSDLSNEDFASLAPEVSEGKQAYKGI